MSQSPTSPSARPPVPAPPVTEPPRPDATPYRLLTEQLPAITYIVELLPAPRTIYISPQVLSILGYSQEEWLAETDFWKGRIDPGDRDRVVDEILSHNVTAEPFFIDYRTLAKDGRTVWIRNSAAYRRDNAGRPAAVHGVMIDITERKRVEQALGEGEAQNRALIRAMPDLVFVNRRNGEFLFFHAPNPSLLAAPPEAILHRNISDLLPPPVAAQCLQAIAATLDTGALQDFNYVLPVAGEDRRFEARVAPCSADTALTIVRDITERRQAEETLETTKQSYLDLLNSITEAIYIQDAAGVFIDVNRGAEAMYRCSRAELVGKNPADVAAPGRNNLPEIARISAEVARTGVSARFRFWAVRKTGEVFPKDVVVNKGRYFGQEVLVAVARDISAQVKDESEREKLQIQLAQARRLEAVGRLAGGVAHDFNNMLQTILGNAELALEDLPPGSPVRACVEEIRKTAGRSADLTRQLLAFARRQTIAPRILDLTETLAGTLKIIQRLIGEGIQLAWHPDPRPCPIEIDPSQLDQIVINLCVNARDAMSGQGVLAIETGTATLDEAACALHDGAVPGPFARLAIRDNGSGMTPETIEHIFEPFFTTKEIGQGTGLGLATVYGIVRQNHGLILVDSAPGEGSAFQVFLPLCANRDLPPAREPAAAISPARGRETILMVEDDAPILDLARRMLEHLGYTLLAAASPFEALRIAQARQDRIHLLVSDVAMPEMNGKELARQIQSVRPGLHCLFMSGHGADILAPQGILDPGVHFIQKPFSMAQLADKIRAILDAPSPHS